MATRVPSFLLPPPFAVRRSGGAGGDHVPISAAASDPGGRALLAALNRTLSGWWCGAGWIIAAATLIGWTQLFHGPSQADAFESVFSTWAIAHGHMACAYPPGNGAGFPFIAPLWPLLSGGISAIARIGNGVPFPSTSALGPHCTTAIRAMSQWSTRSGALTSTVLLGYFGWLALMGGVIAVLRASGRGRCGWEPMALILIACIPPVFMPIQRFFHPQDLLAMGLVLGGVACVRRGSWVWAGALLGLACTSQQFALLVLAPLFVFVPAKRRVRFAGAGIAAAALTVLPMVAVTSGRALGPALIGSGNMPSAGGTVLWELHLHGALLVAISRVLPIALAMTVAWWARRRIGPAVLEPVPLIALVATSLCFRLIFEQNLFGYYFMALAVALVLLDAIRGHIRGQLVAWIALLILAFDPVTWGNDPIPKIVPLWLFQIALVSIATVLAATPLISLSRRGSDSHSISGPLIPQTFPGEGVVPPRQTRTIVGNRRVPVWLAIAHRIPRSDAPLRSLTSCSAVNWQGSRATLPLSESLKDPSQRQ
jgi:hypothetical protein